MTDRVTRRLSLPFAIVLTLAGCRDGIAPLDERTVAGPQAETVVDWPMPQHMLQQSPTAPALETYQLSFWVRHDRETTVAVNCRSGQPFLRFHIPKFGLMRRPDGTRVWGKDSLLITATLDTVNLAVQFQPSGVQFSTVLAPQLVLYYENANPDLNRDGVVDATDQALEQQLAIWGQTARTQGWFHVASRNNSTQQYVAATLYHFSQYAICW